MQKKISPAIAATRSKPKIKDPVYRYPGKVELTGFLKENSKLFNISEFERASGIASSTIRHICAGDRPMRDDEYKKLKMIILPKLCEFVLLLQHYD